MYDWSQYKTASCIKRYPEVIMSSEMVPYESNLTFNAGIIKEEKGYTMLFRNDYGCTQPEWEAGKRFKGTNIGLARSKDGIHWDVEPEPVLELNKLGNPEFVRCYDPRITNMGDGRYIVSFAFDLKHGVCGAFCETHDFKDYKILYISTPDNRNMVLFPEKINGNYVRLERPMPVYSRDGDRFDIWLSESPDLVYWGKSRLVLGTEDVPFCNDKIGPGAPPVKTDKGWLVIFHAVDRDNTRGKFGWENSWKKRYCIGVMLLDLNDPSKVIGMSKQPLIVPEADYELHGGFRDNALFPCGMVKEGSKIRIYYSAGDAVVRMAEAEEEELLALCCESRF